MLKTFPGFVDLGPPELAVLASICKERIFPAGATMHEPGRAVSKFYLVVEGSVHTLKRGRVTQKLGNKSSIGGLAALTRDPRGAHAIAVEDTLALEIEVDDMEDVFEDNFNISHGVLAALARTLREVQVQTGGGASVASARYFEPVTHDRRLHLVEKMFFLRKTTNFGEASIEALADLASHAKEKRFADGTELWAVGDASEYSLLIVMGKVLGFVESGEEIEFPVGYIVGGLDSLSHSPRWYRAVAAGELRALVLRRSYLLDVLEDYPDMMLLLLRGLATGIERTLEMLAAQESAASRRGKDVSPSALEGVIDQG
ncbi:MAG TPA: cyclic nucleotide-binding domain-containing protein [Polyangiaceae bacterium]|jgi:CRP-like cAMP-binding protein|nr:cyclic nucleotide-binding domain-containing protein [Polyangiaceae bacterium]